MKKHHKTIAVTGIIVAILAVAYFIFLYNSIYLSAETVENAESIAITRLDQEFTLDGNADFWQSISPQKVHLYPQAAKSPYGTTERDIWVRAAYNDKEVAFRLDFEDETQNLGAPDNPDACAVLITGTDSSPTAQMMGYGSHANVWQWLADRNVERFQKGNTAIKTVRELVASGPGTQTPLKDQNVDGMGNFANNKWSVMFKRNLNSAQEGEIPFQPGINMKVAFALWEGSRMEGFSRKSIAILRTLTWEKE